MKLSKWQPAESKPKMKGVYQTKDKLGEGAQYWTGKHWGSYSESILACLIRSDKKRKSVWQDVQWRGVIEE